jgi:hypothetical protein
MTTKTKWTGNWQEPKGPGMDREAQRRSEAAKQGAETRKLNKAIADAKAAMEALPALARRRLAADIISSDISKARANGIFEVESPDYNGFGRALWGVSETVGNLTSQLERARVDINYRRDCVMAAKNETK